MPVISLPARTCRFFKRGYCFYEESLNPGRDASYRCVRIVRLLEDWDIFMERAENFGLSLATAARIWNNRRHFALTSLSLCPEMEAGDAVEEDALGDEEQLLNCLYLHHGACILTMPECSGRCERFRLAGMGV